MNVGTIAAVVRGRYGFIARDAESDDIFFHRSGLTNGLACDQRLIGLRVVFSIIQSSKGPRAENVRREE